jgi:DNA-binding MarR family transcriptional regulator
MPADFSPTGLRVLREVAQSGSFSAAARTLGYTQSAVSRQVAALEAAGYVRRDPDPDDRRSQRVSPTEAGAAALRRAHERIVAVFVKALAEWTDEEVRSLTAALGRLRADYEAAAGGGHTGMTSAREAA